MWDLSAFSVQRSAFSVGVHPTPRVSAKASFLELRRFARMEEG